MSDKAVVIHSLAQARAALGAAAALTRPVLLLSAPAAAGYAGPGWFWALVARAREDVPEAEALAVLDCGEAPGHVLAALRDDQASGPRAVCFTGPAETAETLRGLAETAGYGFFPARPAALELRHEDDPETACAAWLAAP
jgi:hypothetical protein